MKERSSAEQQKPDDDYTEDPLTEVLRQGARALLAQAVEEEVTAFLATHAHIRDAQGRHMIVRNGHLPERTIQTGIGASRSEAGESAINGRFRRPIGLRLPLRSCPGISGGARVWRS